VWSWSTIAAVASAAIALCALGLSVGGSRRQRKRDREDADRKGSMQPSLVHCWLELEPSPISQGYVSEVLVAWNNSNQIITNVEGDPGTGRPRVKWREITPGEKARSTVGWRSDSTSHIAQSVVERKSCEIEFDAVTGKRWKRMKDGRVQYRRITPSKDGQIWSEPMAPVVTRYKTEPLYYPGRSWYVFPLISVLIALGILIYYLVQH